MLESLAGIFFDKAMKWLEQQASSLAAVLLGLLNDSLLNFFENDTIVLVLGFFDFISLTVLGISVFVMVVDIAEEKGRGNPVDWSTVFSNFAKGACFCFFAKWIAILSLEITNTVSNIFGLTLAAEPIQTAYDNWVAGVPVIGPQITLLVGLIFALVLIVTTAKFMIESLRRFGSMFVHIGTAFLYIPDILRGSTSKMGEWLRQAFAIALTYFFSYMMYYLGVRFLLEGNMILCLACWLIMGRVAKILNHYGWSTGTTGNFGSIAQMGMSLATKGGR